MNELYTRGKAEQIAQTCSWLTELASFQIGRFLVFIIFSVFSISQISFHSLELLIYIFVNVSLHPCRRDKMLMVGGQRAKGLWVGWITSHKYVQMGLGYSMSDPKLCCPVSYSPICHFLLGRLSLSNSLNLFKPQFPRLYKVDVYRTFLIGMQCRLERILQIKCLV